MRRCGRRSAAFGLKLRGAVRCVDGYAPVWEASACGRQIARKKPFYPDSAWSELRYPWQNEGRFVRLLLVGPSFWPAFPPSVSTCVNCPRGRSTGLRRYPTPIRCVP